MFKLFLGFILIFTLFELNAQALKPWKTTDEGITLESSYNSSLAYDKNLLGLPHVWTSPASNELGRSSLSLTITGAKSSGWNPSELKKSENEYQDGRKKWAQERGYKILSFVPFESKKNNFGLPIHSIGVIYQIKNVSYLELSHFIIVKNQIVHAKFIGPTKLNEWEKFKPILDQLKLVH